MSDILAALREVHAARKMTKVPLPEYPALDPLYFPPMTAHDQTAIMSGVKKGDDAQVKVKWLMRMACDADGKRVFDVPLKDRATLTGELLKIEARVLNRLSMEADGRISTEGATECSTVAEDPDDFRIVAGDYFTAQGLSKLADAIQRVDPLILAKALSDIVAATEAGVTVKNA